jgi:ABC-type taurine transport system substrate-binding protein
LHETALAASADVLAATLAQVHTIGSDKILAPTEIIGVQKIPASKKSQHPQNLSVEKISASTKSWRRHNLGVDKISASTKCWRRRRRIPLLFGSAESTAAAFSETSLNIFYVSLMMLNCLHAVAKCGFASDRPAFMGGLSPVPYRLAVQTHHAENVRNFGADKISAAADISPFFTEL